MRLTWYGAAGFRCETGGQVLLIDPYLSRNRAAWPPLAIRPDDVAGSAIFLSHGHFDHASDVPQIAGRAGVPVYCSRQVARTLRRQGLDERQITIARQGQVFDLGAVQARCLHSKHIRFDLRLLASTLARSLSRLIELLPLLLNWPQGQVLAWRFTLGAEGNRIVQHLGSAGCTEKELARLERMGTPDVLMVPLQGHSHICRIAAHIVERLKPRAAIPHHHDNFYPPISQAVDIAPFVEALSRNTPPVEVIHLPIGMAAEIQGLTRTPSSTLSPAPSAGETRLARRPADTHPRP